MKTRPKPPRLGKCKQGAGNSCGDGHPHCRDRAAAGPVWANCLSGKREGGLGAWRCNLGDISCSSANEFAPTEDFLDTLKLSLLRALPNHTMGGGACLEVLGANVGPSN